MEIVDANYILRYLLKDIEDQYQKASNVIENEIIYIPGEIIAEVVYVLQKVYNIPNTDLTFSLITLTNYPNVNISEKNIIQTAIELLSVNNLDYADNLLLSYAINKEATIYTFDKKLSKKLNHLNQ